MGTKRRVPLGGIPAAFQGASRVAMCIESQRAPCGGRSRTCGRRHRFRINPSTQYDSGKKGRWEKDGGKPRVLQTLREIKMHLVTRGSVWSAVTSARRSTGNCAILIFA